MNPNLTEYAIEVRGVTRQFGPTTALDNVSLDVPRGAVFGLVGANGAGKTTLIKHVLGLLRTQAGSVRVFGLDPVADPTGVLAQVGYLSEDRDLPDWMGIGELLRYTRAFFPDWDDAYAEELRAMFELDAKQKIKGLSRGQRARAGLLVALAHRPALLVLDEPSSGLDPVVRRDILAAIIRTVADEGRTVLFSSHLLDEVERVADRVAMLHAGQLVLCDSLAEIQASHRRVTLRFAAPQSTAPRMPGVLTWSGSGSEWTCLCNGGFEQLKAAAVAQGANIVDEAAPSLDEVFVGRVTARTQEDR